ncbi:cytochrome P450 [Streptomyces sp. NPDC056600]|uniref:cytochrome P450 n=1 Tax=Streptomyces sp. NPDC056600 TaxID=3345874 RepID=UPI003679728C
MVRRLRSPEGLRDPLPVYRAFQELGDVVPAPWGGHFVTGFDVADEVLRGRGWLAPDIAWQERQPDPARWHAPATREMSHTLSRLNAPEHTLRRRALGNPFARGALEAVRPVVEEHVETLLDDLERESRAHGRADFATVVADRLPIRTVGGWLGLPERDHDRVLDFTHRQVFAQELLPTRSELAVSEAATLEMRAYFTALLEHRRAHPGEDVLSDWIRFWDETHAGDRAAADQVLYHLTMFVTIASLETTATLLSTVVSLLLADPARWRWLREHPEHVDDAVEEALRYDPPIWLNSRIAAEDTVLGGVPVAKDGLVHVLFGAAHHDPRRNPDPQAFDVRRRGAHLAFGGGVHYCLGAGLARLEAGVLLTGLLKRFPNLRSAADGPVYAPRLVFRRITSLGVTT